MLPNYCGAMGFAGWLVMLLVWTALVSSAVWGISRLFPGRTHVQGPAVARGGRGEDVPDVPVESRRR